MKPASEYERLSLEILQDQRLRITIFTFSITTVAAICAISLTAVKTTPLSSFALVPTLLAAYTVLIPSAVLVFHYSRGINCKSEYLHIAHSEKWMRAFDSLTEEIIPKSTTLTNDHRILVLVGAYSTENAFRISYAFINAAVAGLAVIVSLHERSLTGWLGVALFVTMHFLMKLFRPISKREYRALWQQWIAVADTK